MSIIYDDLEHLLSFLFGDQMHLLKSKTEIFLTHAKFVSNIETNVIFKWNVMVVWAYYMTVCFDWHVSCIHISMFLVSIIISQTVLCYVVSLNCVYHKFIILSKRVFAQFYPESQQCTCKGAAEFF